MPEANELQRRQQRKNGKDQPADAFGAKHPVQPQSVRRNQARQQAYHKSIDGGMIHKRESSESNRQIWRCPESAQFWPVLRTVSALGKPSRFQTCKWHFAANIAIAFERA